VDVQFDRITSVLAENAIPYWVDSGTLLGLVREGRLLGWDNDIDLAIMHEHLEQFLELAQSLEAKGYAVAKRSWHGLIYKVKLTPLGGLARTIDVNIFREAENHIWCPQVAWVEFGREIASAIERLPQSAWALVDLSFHRILRRVVLRNGVPRHICVDRYPWKRFFKLYTWWIPKDMIFPLGQDISTGISIPGKVELYLNFRYGDWRTPKSNWSFLTDDGGLVHKEPNALLPIQPGGSSPKPCVNCTPGNG